MTAQNLLHYEFSPRAESGKPALVFIHGLFGDLNNLGVIARAFSDDYPILRVDLRNHGRSFQTEEMNYALMAQDVLALIEHLNLPQVIVIGHSMGGKTAMKLTEIAPRLVKKPVVIDIAPVAYQENHHDNVFKGLFAVQQAHAETRQQAKTVFQQYENEEATSQFLLKSFEAANPQKFRFNVTALFANYRSLMDWQDVYVDKPVLFIKGGKSDYILPQYSNAIMRQFPQAQSFIVANAAHWVHAEKPESVVRAIQRFLADEK